MIARRRPRRFVPPWWMSVATLLLIIPAGMLAPAPEADALVRWDTVTISVTWTGSPDCINAWEPHPDDRRTVFLGQVCSPTRSANASYVAHSGEWVGADPEMSGADIIACTLAVNGQIVLSDGASRGDGHEVSCLRKWW